MKKIFKYLVSLLFIFSLLFIPTKVLANEDSYYVCFQSENYAIKNKNIMLKNEDNNTFYLENVTLSKIDAFYITNGKGEKYYSKSNSEMRVEESTSLAYTIFFSKDFNYDNEHVSDGMYVSDCHYTYALYNKGSYTLKLDDDNNITLEFNAYQKKYDSFEASNVELTENQVIEVLGKDENVLASYTIKTTGKYHIIYTPAKVTDGKTYQFNEDGEYGSGDDYIYQIYPEIEEEYFISFKNVNYDKATPIEYNGENLYPLQKDLNHPNDNIYKTESFFINVIDFKLEYAIYLKGPADYILIDDDNDDDTTVSKLTSSYIGWYTLSLTEVNGVYTSKIDIQDKNFGNYYLASGENNYLYTEFGSTNLSDDYKFIKLDSDDDDYNKDYDQYRLFITINNDLLNTDLYITDGLSFYKNGTKYITFNVAGTYEILFSDSHLYGRNQYFKYSLERDDIKYEEIKIESYDDFITMINNCNENPEYSINKYFYLTNDIKVKEDNLMINTFYGTFDGNYHSLLNINLNTDDSLTNIAFFRVLGKNAVIKRLNVSITITADKASNVGFVGYNYGTISNIKISGLVKGLDHVGSIVGYNANYKLENDDQVVESNKNYGYGTITDVINECNIYGERYIGGIAGFNGGKIYECTNNGEINNKSYSSTKTIEGIGGICGYSTGIIAECTNNNIVGYKDIGNFVGGICGLSTGMYYYDFNNGNINGLSYVGGIIGCYGSLRDENDYSEYTEETDLNKHYLTYLYNTGNIYGSNDIAGIIGLVTSTGLNLKNAISSGNVEAKNGSYAGGIIGYLTSGTAESVFATSTIKASGVNQGKYVGGIIGYNGGTVRYAYSTTNLIGNDYIGGIIGYMTSSGKLISSISNTLIMEKNEATEYVGYVIGYVDGLPFADTKNDNIKYNYFIGSEYNGIYKYNFGADSLDMAKKLESDELASKDILSPYLDIDFAQDGFIGGKNEYSYPYLREFEFYKENDNFKDVDYDMEELFNKYHRKFFDLEDKYACISIQINFFEWNQDSGDIDEKEKYELIDTYRFYYNDEIKLYPKFQYAELINNQYIYKTDSSNYIVNWDNNTYDFVNQNVYASYTQIITTLSNENYLIEGSFKEGTTVKIYKYGNTLYAEFKYNNEIIEIDNFVIKMKNKDNKSYKITYSDSDSALDTTQYGDYVVIQMNNSNQRIILTEVVNSFPLWAIISLSALGGILIGVIIILIISKTNKKKAKEA